MRFLLILAFLSLALFTQPLAAIEPNEGKPPTDASQVSPLSVGASIPDITIRNAENKPVQIRSLISQSPTLLIFYRGGWCPFCNTHLGKVATIQKQLKALGFQTIAVSPDSPAKIQEQSKKKELPYKRLSDSKMELSHAFGLAFRLDKRTVQVYKSQYNIDIEADSGETHHLLPVPAAYLIDKQGKIRYGYWNPDYKTRVNTVTLLTEASRMIRK